MQGGGFRRDQPGLRAERGKLSHRQHFVPRLAVSRHFGVTSHRADGTGCVLFHFFAQDFAWQEEDLRDRWRALLTLARSGKNQQWQRPGLITAGKGNLEVLRVIEILICR